MEQLHHAAHEAGDHVQGVGVRVDQCERQTAGGTGTGEVGDQDLGEDDAARADQDDLLSGHQLSSRGAPRRAPITSRFALNAM